MPYIEQNILLNYYRDLFLQINRGISAGGVKINAKPIMLVSIIDMIAEGLLGKNKLCLTEILPKYSMLYRQFQPEKPETPIHKPFFHLSSEPFYHLSWINKTSYNISTISAKFVRENIEYAYLDNALWDLLQETPVQQLLRESLVTHFLIR